MSIAVRRFVMGITLGAAMLAPAWAHAATLRTLYAFAAGTNNGSPFAGLIIDKNGMLYGTTSAGGTGTCQNGCGTIFKLDPATKKLTTLHDFAGGADGENAYAGLSSDKNGVLFGATFAGGSNSCACGTLFEFDPATKAFTKLYDFTDGMDGGRPNSIVVDANGIVYGTTLRAGSGAVCTEACGTVFKFDPATKRLTTLHTFTGGTDGLDTMAGLTIDKTGVLYGATIGGGSAGCGCGTLFMLDPASATLTTIYTFTAAKDASRPNGSRPNALVFDKDGVLYGTTAGGSMHDEGTLFRLDLATRTITSLYLYNYNDGRGWNAGLAFDQKDTLYGVSFGGGLHNAGLVYKFDPAAKKLTPIYTFAGPPDGNGPRGSFVIDKAGALYGTTFADGGHGAGTIFKVTP